MPFPSVLRRAIALAVTLLLSTAANAQLFRAYVASDGNDANPCTLPAPCRLLPAALNAVASGGEIWMLDSANYNTATVTIGKSVSILAVPGAVGSVVAVGGPAISITAGSLTVALRNLVIVPLAGGGGTHGVMMTGASTLSIEDSLIANLSSNGVYVTGTGKVKVTRTIIRNNVNYAVWLRDGASATISATQMLQNYVGVSLPRYHYHDHDRGCERFRRFRRLLLRWCLGVRHLAGAIAKIFVTRSTIHGVVYALDSESNNGGQALVSVSSSMITNNNYGWILDGAGAVVESSGNNHIRANATNQGSLTAASLQ